MGRSCRGAFGRGRTPISTLTRLIEAAADRNHLGLAVVQSAVRVADIQRDLDDEKWLTLEGPDMATD
jgi:hypothetical protein